MKLYRSLAALIVAGMAVIAGCGGDDDGGPGGLLDQGSGSEPSGDEAAPGDEGDRASAGGEGATIPADADITSEVLCTVLVGSEIPAPGFEGVVPEPLEATGGDGTCKWSSDDAGSGFVLLSSHKFIDDVDPDDPPLETDGREGSIKEFDAGECFARFRRGEGTIGIEVVGVDDLCGGAEELAQLLAPRFPQA